MEHKSEIQKYHEMLDGETFNNPYANFPTKVLYAFSKWSRRIMLERADFKSELSGVRDRPLQASHFNHDKKSELYDDLDNGQILTDYEHLAFHIAHWENPSVIGLNHHSNEYAIRTMISRIKEYNEKNGIYDDILAKVNEVIKKHFSVEA